MKVIIDARMLFWTGVGRYTKNLLEQLEESDSKDEFFVLVRSKDWKIWEPKAKNFKRVMTDIDPYTVAEQLMLPGVIRKLRPDLVHFTAPNTPWLYRGKKIVTIHDLTLIDYDTSRGSGVKKALRGLKRIPFRLVFRRGANTAAAVISGTEYVKQQLVSRFHLASEKVRVIPLGVEPEMAKPSSVEKFKTGKKYLFYVGNYFPYKNVGVVVEAMSKIAVHHPEYKLVLAGKPDFFSEQLKARVKNLKLTDKVIFAGFVTEEELAGLYQKATIYINPSLSEGFGLQGLEAMTHGVPVVAANATCLPEVYEKAAEYFDPLSANDLADKINHLLDSKTERERLIKHGNSRVKEFTWKKVANETLETYKSTHN
jgi:glycosyltransferase involved in cell wall biosynthesis